MAFGELDGLISGNRDVSLNNPTDGQVLGYNASLKKWQNQAATNAGDPVVGGDLSGTASNAQIVANAVGPNELAVSAVTTAKIADNTVTEPKLSVSNSPTNGQLLAWNGSALAWTTVSSGSSGTSTPPCIVVAASTASAAIKASANYVCDGTDDQVEINSAINDAAALQAYNAGMPAGAVQAGKVLLTGGRFTTTGAIQMRTAVWLEGSGFLTELKASTNNDTGMITLASPSDHLCQVSNLWLNGNFSGGGLCNGIDFDMSSSGNTSGYPDTNPDSYHQIHDLLITGFTTGTRHGIYLHAASTSNNRGNMIFNITMRNVSGNGIYLSASSDSSITNCQIGTVTGTGYYIATGNTRIIGCKSFYCDTQGFYISSGRGSITACESQDDNNGYVFTAGPFTASNLVADTSQTAGITISTSELQLNSFNVFVRSGGRYATMATGLSISASTYTDCTVVGHVKGSSVTTTIGGSLSAANRNFMRVNDSSSLVSVG